MFRKNQRKQMLAVCKRFSLIRFFYVENIGNPKSYKSVLQSSLYNLIR